MPSHPEKLEIVTEVPDRAMVIFAHPDDAEIGSGGVIATWIAAGCEATYVLCTNGAAGTADRALTPHELVRKRTAEQRAAADAMGVKHVVMLGYPDGELEDTRDFLGDVVRAIRQYRPHTVFVHDPHRIHGFQHRDHRNAGIVTTDAVYPYARDHLHFPEHVSAGVAGDEGDVVVQRVVGGPDGVGPDGERGLQRGLQKQKREHSRG